MGSVFTPESLLCLQQCGTANRMKLSVLTWNYESHDIDNDVVGRKGIHRSESFSLQLLIQFLRVFICVIFSPCLIFLPDCD